MAQARLPARFFSIFLFARLRISSNFNFTFSIFLFAPDCATVSPVNLNRTQILGALILAAIALVILLLRWKFAH